MKIFLPDIVRPNGSLDLTELPDTNKTIYISVMGQDGSGKTTLRNNLADFFEAQGNTVITAKSPCDKYLVGLLNNAISQNGYNDWYTEQLLFSFADGLLSNYMVQLKGHCDYFICQRGPADQYDHGITRSGRTYEQIHEIQRPERLAKFDMYIHMNCDAKVAWNRIRNDEDKDRYEYPEYFDTQVKNTKALYDNICNVSEYPSLQFMADAKHIYVDSTYLSIDQVFEIVLKEMNGR